MGTDQLINTGAKYGGAKHVLKVVVMMNVASLIYGILLKTLSVSFSFKTR